MSNIERGESVVTTPAKVKVTAELIRKANKIPAGVELIFVTANGSISMDADSVIVAEWTETKPKKTRAKRVKEAA